ncbi:hypothetical protein ACU686_23860 [Yinghuangia aomiensis]
MKPLTGRDKTRPRPRRRRSRGRGDRRRARARRHRSSAAVRALFTEIAANGSIDCLVANAGVLEDAPIGMIRDGLTWSTACRPPASPGALGCPPRPPPAP